MADWLGSNWEGLILGLAFGSYITAWRGNVVQQRKEKNDNQNN